MPADLPDLPFTTMTRMEEALWAELIVAWSSEKRAISISAEDNIDPHVTGEFLRWFLLEAVPTVKLAIVQVDLTGIEFANDLNFAGTKLEVQVRFLSCCFAGRINFSDATVISLELVAGTAMQILADRLTATGSLKIRADISPGAAPKPFTIHRQLSLNGAKIRGNLDLRGCQLGDGQERIPLFADGLAVEGNVFLSDGFAAAGEVRLNGCKIRRNLDCSGATLTNLGGYSISAAGAEIDGSAYLCRTPPDWAIYALQRPFISIGTVRLEGARIKGDLDCSAGRFTASRFRAPDIAPTNAEHKNLYAIQADGLNVGANIKFSSREATNAAGAGAGADFVVHGAISLISATVGGDFILTGGRFDFPGEELLVADGIKVAGTTFINGARINGIIRLVQADLKEGLYVIDASFDTTPACQSWFGDDNASWTELEGPACGIYAPLAEVGRTFFWERNTKISAQPPPATKYWLYLPGSAANTIYDDEMSWSQLDRFDVNGCRYYTIADLTGYDWRLRQLDRQYAILNDGRPIRLGLRALGRAFGQRLSRVPSPDVDFADAIERFKPQPYLQLARTFRSAGYEVIANQVLIHFQRNKTRYSDFGLRRQLGRWIVDLFLRYGFLPFRPLLWLAIWAAVSAVYFELAYAEGKIVPTKDVPQSSAASARPRFNALLYSIDTLLPIVDFNQKKSWTVETIGSAPKPPPTAPISFAESFDQVWYGLPRPGASLLLVVNTFFGWLMTTLFAAGISGLLRTGREEG